MTTRSVWPCPASDIQKVQSLIHGRAQGHWSILADITYIETSDDDTFTVPGLGSVRTDSKSEQIYADLLIAYWPWTEAGGVSVCRHSLHRPG